MGNVEKVFSEQISSVDVERREQFAAALDFVRAGDTLVVTKLDRLARSVRHLHDIVEQLKQKGVALQILNLGIDLRQPHEDVRRSIERWIGAPCALFFILRRS